MKKEIFLSTLSMQNNVTVKQNENTDAKLCEKMRKKFLNEMKRNDAKICELDLISLREAE
jgi:hypothetical protein